MRNNDGSYDRYRRDEAELREQLEERRRAAEDAAEWDGTRQTLRQLGVLERVESNLHKLRSALITSERKGGKALADARLYADCVIARVRKDLRSSSLLCRPDEPAEAESLAGQ